jgi:hypothetical protein
MGGWLVVQVSSNILPASSREAHIMNNFGYESVMNYIIKIAK